MKSRFLKCASETRNACNKVSEKVSEVRVVSCRSFRSVADCFSSALLFRPCGGFCGAKTGNLSWLHFFCCWARHQNSIPQNRISFLDLSTFLALSAECSRSISASCQPRIPEYAQISALCFVLTLARPFLGSSSGEPDQYSSARKARMDDSPAAANAATASRSAVSGCQSSSTIGPQHDVIPSQEVGHEMDANYCVPRTSSASFSKLPANPSHSHAPPTSTSDDTNNASTFSEFAHSSRTNLQSLMNSAHPKAIDWTALHAEQLRHYGRLTKRRSSESLRSQMDLHHEEEKDDEPKPGQNASWGEQPVVPQQNHNSSTYGPDQSTAHINMTPTSNNSSAANAFLSILNSSPSTSAGTSASSALPTTGTSTGTSMYGRGSLTLTRRPSTKSMSSPSSSLHLQRPAAQQTHARPTLSRVRSDQWLDYRRRLEAATGVPMVTAKRGIAGAGLGLTRSTSKRGLVLSRSSSRSSLGLSKSTSTSRSSLLLSNSTSRFSLLALAGRTSQSNSTRSLSSQTSATSVSTGIQSLTPNSSVYVAVATGSEASANMIRASSFCKKMSLKDTPLK